MNNRSIRKLAVALAIATAAALGLLWALGEQSTPAVAAPVVSHVEGPRAGPARAPAAELYVCATCTYTNVQAAVDAANDGDVIKVAAGTYTGVNSYGGLAQVVYISKTVTIRGGYTAEFTEPPDPENNQTTLDAGGLGRVLYVTGDISPTIEGLRITSGDAAGLGGLPWTGDAGGGVYVYTATATISNCVVYSNTASTTDRGFGGGLFLRESDATLVGNTVVSNTASTTDLGGGGGLFLQESDATLVGNTVQGNTASTAGGTAGGGDGGGLYLSQCNTTLSGNTIVGNTASEAGANDGRGGGLFADLEGGDDSLMLSGNTVQGNTASTAYQGRGGGVYITDGPATLRGNTVQGNTASRVDDGYGGGLYLTWPGNVALSGNTIVSNTATLSPAAIGQGGGLWVDNGSPFTLTNNLVADNHANTEGSGLWLDGESGYPTAGRLLHTTIADNAASGGSGQGVFVGDYTTLAFTNTIIAGHHSVGITVTTGSTATLEATLWHGNGADTGGGGYIFIGTVNVYNDPAFFDPAAWDYHLTSASAAIDQGVEAGVITDIDGDARPIGPKPDLGADEAWRWVYLPLVLRNF